MNAVKSLAHTRIFSPKQLSHPQFLHSMKAKILHCLVSIRLFSWYAIVDNCLNFVVYLLVIVKLAQSNDLAKFGLNFVFKWKVGNFFLHLEIIKKKISANTRIFWKLANSSVKNRKQNSFLENGFGVLIVYEYTCTVTINGLKFFELLINGVWFWCLPFMVSSNVTQFL